MRASVFWTERTGSVAPLTCCTFSERELSLTSVSLGTSPRGVSVRDPVHPQEDSSELPPAFKPPTLSVSRRAPDASRLTAPYIVFVNRRGGSVGRADSFDSRWPCHLSSNHPTTTCPISDLDDNLRPAHGPSVQR